MAHPVELLTHEDEGNEEDGKERDAEGLECVAPDGEVLLVEHVEDRVGEDADALLLWQVRVDGGGQRGGQAARPVQGRRVVLQSNALIAVSYNKQLFNDNVQ